MNPFSRYLSQWSKSDRFAAFVERWDQLEELVIRTYRSGQAAPADEDAFATTWPWLREEYVHWERQLATMWPATKVAGEPAGQDPFLRLLAAEALASFANDWEALQYLPAARETLNRVLAASDNS